MSYDATPIRMFELSVRTINIIERWKADATLGDVRKMYDPVLPFRQRFTSKAWKELGEVLANCTDPAPKIGLFDHITADAVRAERVRTGHGMAECKREMQRAALLDHIDGAEKLDTRLILRWLVERAA